MHNIDKSHINNDFTYFTNVQKLPVDVMRSSKVINISGHACAAEHVHFRADDANHGWCFAIHSFVYMFLSIILANNSTPFTVNMKHW